jgi:F-type H+-transporting ATPase subunit a
VSPTQRFLLVTAVIAGAVYAILSALYPRFLPPAASSGLLFGVAVSAANAIGSYFIGSWGARSGDKQFLQAFVIAMLGRFAVIGFAAVAAYAIDAIDFRGAMLAMLAAFFPLTGYEVYCVVRALDARSARAPATATGKSVATAVSLAAAAAIATAATLAAPASLRAETPAHDAHDAHGAPAAGGDHHADGAHHGDPAHAPDDAHHAGEAAHHASGAHAADAHHGDEHGGGDVFSHLFHHLQDEVVFPLPVVNVGGIAIDLSVTKLVVMIWIVCALNLLIFGTLAAKSRSLVPRGRFHNLFEALVVFVKKDMVEEIMGHHLGPKFTPYFLTVFFFILFCNLLGLVPFMHTATGNIAVTASMAALTFLLMQISGIREQGLVGYAKSIVPGGIPLWLYPIMVPVEILGMFTKPFALTIRLFANMTAGHVVILSLFGLLFLFKTIVLAPAVLGFVLFVYALELLVAFLQAYIFTFLSILFVNACAHPDH